MRLRSSKLFIRNFILLFSMLSILLICFSLYIYQNSKQILEEELTDYNLQNTAYLSNTFEQEIEEAKYLISTLTINSKVAALMSSPSSPFVSTYYLSDITDMLQSLCYSNQAIETIYIYCESNNKIYRPESSYETDYSWIGYLNPNKYGISIFPYALYEQFPYVICVAKETEYNGMRSVICCMLNLANMASLDELSTNKNQHFFIISDEEYIIYRDRQRDAKEPLNVSQYLSHYDPAYTQTPVIYTENGIPYAFGQLHSTDYPWTYALCTQLTEYTSRLSSSRAVALAIGFLSVLISVLFAIFISNRSLKPIISIKQLLDKPDYFSGKGVNNSEEITYIAKKIIAYVQTNQQLAEELDTQINLLTETRKQNLQLQINPHFLFNTLNIMYMQAADSLGYDHTLPGMIQNLGALLRYTLDPSYMTTFKTELHYTNIYLEILTQRYGEHISIVCHTDPKASAAKVPRLFLQPIIENAVFHGFAKQHDRECILTISCQVKENEPDQASMQKLILTIADNGSGMENEALEHLRHIINAKVAEKDDGRHIGMRNVSQRLNLFFAGEAQITVTSAKNAGTTFTIVLPYIL